MTKYINLGNGHEAIVDDDDYEYLSKHKWHVLRRAHKKEGAMYATRTQYSKNNCNDYKYKKILMHREIMGAQDNLDIDHINGNGLDNRKCNLRICTRKENMRNKKGFSSKTSTYKGVYWRKGMNKWGVQISPDRKKIHIGFFDDEVEAAKAYDRAARYYYGEFAYLNFHD